MTSAEIFEALAKFGLPTVLLLALIYAVWRVIGSVGHWVATKVVEPLVESARGFVASVQEAQEKSESLQIQQGVTLGKLADASDKQNENLGKLVHLSEQQSGMLGQQREMLRQLLDAKTRREERERDQTA